MEQQEVITAMFLDCLSPDLPPACDHSSLPIPFPFLYSFVYPLPLPFPVYLATSVRTMPYPFAYCDTT